MKQQMIRAFVPKTWDVRFYFIALDNRFQSVSLVVIFIATCWCSVNCHKISGIILSADLPGLFGLDLRRVAKDYCVQWHQDLVGNQ